MGGIPGIQRPHGHRQQHHHPYYPLDLPLPNYAPNAWPIPIILGSFAGLIALFIGSGLAMARWKNPLLKRKGAEQFAIGWFLLCGFLHCFFEGYFVFYHDAIPSSQSLFAQLWKEYSLSDSRYISADPFMLCIETLTMLLWGPLSLLTAYLIATGANKGTRHVLQITVCIAHLYGVALYYGTCGFIERYGGISYSRPEFLYYWVYYAGMNAPWGTVPVWLLWRSVKEVGRAFESVEYGAEGGKKDN
ncbi:Emopamil binding protein-domain-containing protein [Cladorrhinum sp. PSN332]|nr:Emopamil binding protein-domain-containing protein [Cladorrhinum sp. PSN332]